MELRKLDEKELLKKIQRVVIDEYVERTDAVLQMIEDNGVDVSMERKALGVFSAPGFDPEGPEPELKAGSEATENPPSPDGQKPA